MVGKNFGEKIQEERRRQELLYPCDYAPRGTAGVYVKHYTKGGDYHEPYYDDYGPSSRIVHRPYVHYTDVYVVDEKFAIIGTRTFRKLPLLPESLHEDRVLSSIEKAFQDAASYAAVVGVPVDLNQTHADVGLSWER